MLELCTCHVLWLATNTYLLDSHAAAAHAAGPLFCLVIRSNTLVHWQASLPLRLSHSVRFTMSSRH